MIGRMTADGYQPEKHQWLDQLPERDEHGKLVGRNPMSIDLDVLKTVGLLSPNRLPSGGRNSHSYDLDRMVAALFDVNDFHRVPGEHKACYHLGREALSHQFRIGDTTQAGISHYFYRTAPTRADGHLRIPLLRTFPELPYPGGTISISHVPCSVSAPLSEGLPHVPDRHDRGEIEAGQSRVRHSPLPTV
jgi:hypothetical protein